MSGHSLDVACMRYIEEHQLFGKNTVLLVGVSGGKDSMVLASILHRAGYTIRVAHCNFHLRGHASDADERLVQKWCDERSIPYTIAHFETQEYAKNNSISIEMAARELRYKWFEDIRISEKAQAVAVAHHLNDHVETFMLNITRGTGISGLKGIMPKSGNVVRPLLFASRQMIDDYASDFHIPFHNDHTNEDTHFKRNFLRHEIVPRFQQLNPAFLNTMQQNMLRFEHVVRFMEAQFETMEQKLVTQTGSGMFIGFPEEHEIPVFADFLHYLFTKNEFTIPVDEVASLLHSQVGKRVLFENKQVVKERSGLAISEVFEDAPGIIQINSFPASVSFTHYEITISTKPAFNSEDMPYSNHTVWIDADKIQLPLTIRAWQPGDTMIPLGMEGKRKIKKMLTDAKIPNSARNNYPVVCDKNAIIWLPNIRLHHTYAVSDSTRRIIELSVRVNQ